jgi:hypothetical protein
MTYSLVDTMDIYEAAARDAIFHGDGAIVTRRLCCHECYNTSGSVWFGSRLSWVCLVCDNDVPGTAPTEFDRMSGKPNNYAIDTLLKQYAKGLDIRFDKK